MDAKKLTGSKAGSHKYDLLTAITVVGLHGNPGFQTSMLRLTALITARYNWRLDEFSVGQRDMARMWCVNERTVKREIKRLLEAQIITCKRQGVRGRVGAYKLNFNEIYRRSRSIWTAVGPDFDERMQTNLPQINSTVVTVNFAKDEFSKDRSVQGRGEWRHVLQRLKAAEPEVYSNWYSQLLLVALEESTLTIKAPSRFIARYVQTNLDKSLVNAAEAELGPVDRLVVMC